MGGRSTAWCLLAVPGLLAAAPARAGGGADVVDDAATEAPGTCYVETWITRYRAHSGLLNVGPACAPKALPGAEIGATFQRLIDGRNQTIGGPVAKWRLRSPGSGPGVAADAGADWDFRTGRLEDATALVPVTVILTPRLTISANAGYSYVRIARERHALFWGAQFEAQVARDFGLMVEGFGRTGDRAGLQARLRWTPHDGRLDVDLVGGRYIDGISPSALTLGFTVRR